ncbi:hypothetical protein [Cardinium endosymbiont of Dermatophagoides farinae]|nr:hypothetical protein [Cardinium endosymbiont of Dermatophagoides farinae]
MCGYKRPSSKPICDQQFLGEAQSSTAEYWMYLRSIDKLRHQNCH